MKHVRGLLPERLRRNLAPPNGVPLLPSRTMSREQIEAAKQPLRKTAKEQLQMTVRPCDASVGFIPVAQFNTRRGSIAMAYHHTNHNLQSYTHVSVVDGEERRETIPGLFRTFAHSWDITWNLRHIEAKYENAVRHLKALKERVNPAYREFLDECLEWVQPTLDPLPHRDLWIWGPTDAMVSRDNAETAALHGEPVTYLDAGSALLALIHRLPAHLSEVPINRQTRSRDHLIHAAIENLVFWNDRWEHDHRAHAAWKVQLTAEVMPHIINSGYGFDIIMRVFYVLDPKSDQDPEIYAVCMLRTATKIGKLDKFVEVNDYLNDLGIKASQIKGEDNIQTAWRCTVGAEELPTSWLLADIERPREFMTQIANSLIPVGNPQGTRMLGRLYNRSYLIDPETHPNMLVTAESKIGGKTTWSNWVGLARGPEMFIMNFGGGEYEAATEFCHEFGGTVQKLNLPDSHELIVAESKGLEKIEPEEVLARQRELHIQDGEQARRDVEELFDTWEKHGKIVGMPITWYPETGNTVRLLHYYWAWLRAFKELWPKRIWLKHGWRSLFIADNFSRLLELPVDDPLLGELPLNIGKNLGLELTWFTSQGANNGLHFMLLTHSEHDLDWTFSGWYKHFTLHMQLGKDVRHEYADVVRPKQVQEAQLLVNNLYVRLPYKILRVVARREPENVQ